MNDKVHRPALLFAPAPKKDRWRGEYVPWLGCVVCGKELPGLASWIAARDELRRRATPTIVLRAEAAFAEGYPATALGMRCLESEHGGVLAAGVVLAAVAAVADVLTRRPPPPPRPRETCRRNLRQRQLYQRAMARKRRRRRR